MNDDLKKILKKQQYKIVGDHSAVKLCSWVRKKLLFDRPCYKESFYGINCHRCLQMTPVVNQCTQACVFCWRHQGFDERNQTWDEPAFILDNSIEAQRLLVSGFRGDERCNEAMWHEAREPKHVAVSLSGEPTMYPYLDELFAACHARGMTTFLVTNGTMPDVLENLNTLPTQLYVTVAAPDKETYKRICAPKIADGWEKLQQTLELLPSLGKKTRTVVRHTLAAGLNLGDEALYARLDAKAEPTFVESKAYMFVGSSRERLSLANMPKHEQIAQFSERLAAELGYVSVNEKKDSRVTLLAQKHGDTRLKLP